MVGRGAALMPIALLPDEVSSLIAAGEVVERPASVVKELLENSLDAGARRIEIRIEGAGRKRIEVADDGVGIPSGEVALAPARHATSKLRTADDLLAIRTLGFRGEALASIAAVSRFELGSRAAGQEAGSRLTVQGGGAGALRSAGMPPGTQVVVQDLFFNIPARLKFLRSDETERRRIHSLVARYAAAYPAVRFRLSLEGRTVVETTGRGDPQEALGAVFGAEIASRLLALPEVEAAGSRVAGFVSPLDLHRSNRKEITLFVNGRWVQDAGLTAAVVQAYHTLLMVGRFPLAVILLAIPPDQVDVNVHPAKTEIRLRDPEAVFGLVQRAVRATVLRQGPPAVDWRRTETAPWGGSAAGRRHGPDPAWELAHGLELPRPTGTIVGQSSLLPSGDLPLLRPVGQVGAAYLVAEGPDGLYLIDQHAAHERVLFENLMEARQAGSPASQALLEPASVELSPEHAQLLEPQLPILESLGFEVEAFGGATYRVRALPALLARLNPTAALRAAVEDFEEDERPLGAELEARLAARVCKRAAIKSGQVLSLAEQAELIRTLEACASPRTCPHGRPTMIHLSVDSLERQFGRRG